MKLLKSFFKYFILTTVITLTILSFFHTTKALSGICMYKNRNGTIKYVNCYCNCNRYKLNYKGVCPRCGHRHDFSRPDYRASFSRPASKTSIGKKNIKTTNAQ